VRKQLSRVRLFLCVPLGVLWIGVMAVIAVPVILFMTALYYARPRRGAERGAAHQGGVPRGA